MWRFVAAALRTHDPLYVDVTVPSEQVSGMRGAAAFALFQCLATYELRLWRELAASGATSVLPADDAAVAHPNVASSLAALLLRPRAWRVTHFKDFHDPLAVTTPILKCRATCALRDGTVAAVVPRRSVDPTSKKATYGLIVVDPSTGQLLEDYRALSPHWVVNARSVAELSDGRIAVSVQRRDQMRHCAVDVISRAPLADPMATALRKMRIPDLGGSVAIAALPGNRLLAMDYDGNVVAVLAPQNLEGAPTVVRTTPQSGTPTPDGSAAVRGSSGSLGASASGSGSSNALQVDDSADCGWAVVGRTHSMKDAMSGDATPVLGRRSAAVGLPADARVRCVAVAYSAAAWAVLECGPGGVVDLGARHSMLDIVRPRDESKACGVAIVDDETALCVKEGDSGGMWEVTDWQLAAREDDDGRRDASSSSLVGDSKKHDDRAPQLSDEAMLEHRSRCSLVDGEVFRGADFFDCHYCPETRMFVAGDVAASDGGFACYRVASKR